MQKRDGMLCTKYRVFSLSLVASIGLAACTTEGDQTSSRKSAFTSSSEQGVERDVEDASIFSLRETGLWDGRPSLGGVWVAHPDATSPERVIIRNIETGSETTGALFRRERLNPGPSFQISGEAANALGVLAGAPTMIEVIALRSELVQPGTQTESVSPSESSEVGSEADLSRSEVSQAIDIEVETPTTQADDESSPRREGGFLRRFINLGI